MDFDLFLANQIDLLVIVIISYCVFYVCWRLFAVVKFHNKPNTQILFIKLNFVVILYKPASSVSFCRILVQEFVCTQF